MYQAAPSEILSVYCQFNDTGGSAANATSPVVRVVSYNTGTSKHVEISGSPFSLVAIPEDGAQTGWYAARVTIPAGATVGEILGVRFYGTCDGETPASSDQIIVRNIELTDAVLTAAHGADNWTTGLCGWPGEGANRVTLTLQCSGVAVINQRCIVRDASSGVVVAGYWTNSDGQNNFQIDDGDYLVWYGPSNRYGFENPYELTVDGDTTPDPYTCVAIEAQACGLTLAEMRSTLERAVAMRQHQIEKTLYDQWINAGYLEVDRRVGWTRTIETITTVADQQSYARPGDVEVIVGVRAAKYTDENDKIRVLQEISMEELIHKQSSTTTAGDPEFYVLEGDLLYFSPTPDTADETLTLYCLATPPTLEDDDDKPAFACHLHDLVITSAMGKAYRHIEEDALGLSYETIFEAQLREAAKRSDMNRAASSNIAVTGP